jgi:cell division inhibitor SepF
MGFGDTFKKFIGIEAEDEEIEVTAEEVEAEKKKLTDADIAKPAREESSRPIQHADNSYNEIAPLIDKGSQKSNRVSMNGSAPFKMLVIEPKSFDECTKLVDNLKSRKPVIINLEKVETDLARKIFDFLSGATYALNGNVQRVTSNIFIFAPANVDIAAKLNKTQAAVSNYSDGKSPWEK